MMPDEDGNLTDDNCRALIEKSDKDTLWWALYRLAGAIHAARYDDPHCKGEGSRGGLYSVVHYTADHWLPQIEGMPTFAVVAAYCRADDAHHELTKLGERLGVYLTGDEFF